MNWFAYDCPFPRTAGAWMKHFFHQASSSNSPVMRIFRSGPRILSGTYDCPIVKDWPLYSVSHPLKNLQPPSPQPLTVLQNPPPVDTACYPFHQRDKFCAECSFLSPPLTRRQPLDRFKTLKQNSWRNRPYRILEAMSWLGDQQHGACKAG